MTPRIRCPICRVEIHGEHNPCRPFCSERCRLIDFGAWAAERYRIPGPTPEGEHEGEDNDPDEGSA